MIDPDCPHSWFVEHWHRDKTTEKWEILDRTCIQCGEPIKDDDGQK